MGRRVYIWKTPNGRKGFIQEELGWFSKKLVVYESGKGFLGLGSKKIGELPSNLKAEDLLRELKKLVGEEKIEILYGFGRVFPSYFYFRTIFSVVIYFL